MNAWPRELSGTEFYKMKQPLLQNTGINATRSVQRRVHDEAPVE